MDEGGFDPGFFADYECMKKSHTIAYAASFGDTTLNESVVDRLSKLLRNFKSISLRENKYLELTKSLVDEPVFKVVDPTLLLQPEDYSCITAPKQESEPYLLMYSRRYNPEMERYARFMAAKNGLKLVEISIRAENSRINEMRYDAGVEEFLALVKNADFVVTNSFHGMLFSIQFRRPFYVFSRELGNSKITEILDLFGLRNLILQKGEDNAIPEIDYMSVHSRIETEREKSIEVLKLMLNI